MGDNTPKTIFAAAAAITDPTLDGRASVRVVTLVNITLSGIQTIDGVLLVSEDRVLVKDQSSGSENGIWLCSSGSWSRSSDYNDTSKVHSGNYFHVEEGTRYGGHRFHLTNTGTITVGTTALSFAYHSKIEHLDIHGGLRIGRGAFQHGNHGGLMKQLFIQSVDPSITTNNDGWGWWVGTHASTVTGAGDLSATNNVLYFGVASDADTSVTGVTSVPAQIEDNTGSAVQMNFTGQHRCFINNEISDMIGLIASSTGNYVNLDNSNTSSINESLPICKLSNTDSDKSVFGVVSEKEDTNTGRKFKPSNFVSLYEKKNTNERRFHINSLGEGSIWITNKNGSFVNGDYITTSTIPGYGQKQTGELLCNYTVSKITCSCDFSVTPIVKQKVKVVISGTTQSLEFDSLGNIQYENDLDSDGNQQNVLPFNTRYLLSDGTQIIASDYTTRLGNGESVYIACFVGCTYHCG